MTARSRRPADEQRARRLHDELAAIAHVLPASVVERRMACGKASCRCHGDPPELHGPYLQWTRRGQDGRTVTRHLTPEQAERHRPWFDNARRLRSIVSELEHLSLRIVEGSEESEPTS